MARRTWLELAPSLLLALGILLAALVAAWTASSGWPVLAGPLVLALSVVGADVLVSRLRGEALRPSPASLILGVAFLAAGWVVSWKDPALVKLFVATSGSTAWFVLLLRSSGRRQACRARISG